MVKLYFLLKQVAVGKVIAEAWHPRPGTDPSGASYHLPPVEPWESYLTSLSCSFTICEMELSALPDSFLWDHSPPDTGVIFLGSLLGSLGTWLDPEMSPLSIWLESPPGICLCISENGAGQTWHSDRPGVIIKEERSLRKIFSWSKTHHGLLSGACEKGSYSG